MHEICSQTAPAADFEKVKCIHDYETIRVEYAAYLSDESKLSGVPFDFLFFPKEEAELAVVIKSMNQRGIALTIAGARTGLVGG